MSMKAHKSPRATRDATMGCKVMLSKGGMASVIVRSLVPEDFDFVRSLAASVTGYTVCPSYLLWMLSRLHGPFCAVAVAPDETRLGYLLAMPTSNPIATVFVWQLVTTFRGRRLRAQYQLASFLREAIQKREISQILFTSVPNSAAERSVRSLAKRVFFASPHMTQRLPESVSKKEREFSLSFDVSRKRK